MLTVSIFSFITLNLIKKGILHFYVTRATDLSMEEVIDSCLHRAIWRKTNETLKALILTIIVLNLASKGLSFYYTAIFTGPSISSGPYDISNLQFLSEIAAVARRCS